MNPLKWVVSEACMHNDLPWGWGLWVHDLVERENAIVINQESSGKVFEEVNLLCKLEDFDNVYASHLKEIVLFWIPDKCPKNWSLQVAKIKKINPSYFIAPFRPDEIESDVFSFEDMSFYAQKAKILSPYLCPDTLSKNTLERVAVVYDSSEKCFQGRAQPRALEVGDYVERCYFSLRVLDFIKKIKNVELLDIKDVGWVELNQRLHVFRGIYSFVQNPQTNFGLAQSAKIQKQHFASSSYDHGSLFRYLDIGLEFPLFEDEAPMPKGNFFLEKNIKPLASFVKFVNDAQGGTASTSKMNQNALQEFFLNTCGEDNVCWFFSNQTCIAPKRSNIAYYLPCKNWLKNRYFLYGIMSTLGNLGEISEAFRSHLMYLHALSLIQLDKNHFFNAQLKYCLDFFKGYLGSYIKAILYYYKSSQSIKGELNRLAVVLAELLMNEEWKPKLLNIKDISSTIYDLLDQEASLERIKDNVYYSRILVDTLFNKNHETTFDASSLNHEKSDCLKCYVLLGDYFFIKRDFGRSLYFYEKVYFIETDFDRVSLKKIASLALSGDLNKFRSFYLSTKGTLSDEDKKFLIERILFTFLDNVFLDEISDERKKLAIFLDEIVSEVELSLRGLSLDLSRALIRYFLMPFNKLTQSAKNTSSSMMFFSSYLLFMSGHFCEWSELIEGLNFYEDVPDVFLIFLALSYAFFDKEAELGRVLDLLEKKSGHLYPSIFMDFKPAYLFCCFLGLTLETNLLKEVKTFAEILDARQWSLYKNHLESCILYGKVSSSRNRSCMKRLINELINQSPYR